MNVLVNYFKDAGPVAWPLVLMGLVGAACTRRRCDGGARLVFAAIALATTINAAWCWWRLRSLSPSPPDLFVSERNRLYAQLINGPGVAAVATWPAVGVGVAAALRQAPPEPDSRVAACALGIGIFTIDSWFSCLLVGPLILCGLAMASAREDRLRDVVYALLGVATAMSALAVDGAIYIGCRHCAPTPLVEIARSTVLAQAGGLAAVVLVFAWPMLERPAVRPAAAAALLAYVTANPLWVWVHVLAERQ